MLDIKDFSLFENQSNFDFKGFLLKIAGYWKLFVISLIIAFTIAYQVNIRKEKIYELETLISVKEENNPLFTSSTNLIFNWGGASDQVQTISTKLTSRSHNELVVKSLQYYINYMQQGKYNLLDVYGATPFRVIPNLAKPQLLNNQIKVKLLSQNNFEIETNFESNQVELQNYGSMAKSKTTVPIGVFKKQYAFGQEIRLPFLNVVFALNPNPGLLKGQEYVISFTDFDSSVSTYKGIGVKSDEKGSSIITLSMQGNNKARIVEYLNTTVKTLIKSQLDDKNQFATNTISFIDSTLVSMEGQLKNSETELKNFSKDKNIYTIEEGGEKFSEKMVDFDMKKDEITRKIAYYNSLKAYLKNNNDYSKLPAPTVAGIEDPNILTNVSKLIALSAERSQMAYTIKSENAFKEYDSQMDAMRKVLLENITNAKQELSYDLNLINNKINQIENQIRRLPNDQQELIKIKRKYNLNDKIYNTFLQKRSEADIAKASNMPDIKFIDPAKDIGEGLIGPKTGVNYALAFFLGLLIPLIVVIVIYFVNNSIQNIDDISKITNIPIIGIIGVSKDDVSLPVFLSPKSSFSESFRSVRSSLQFLYKKRHIEGAKTLMITSSVSGEGKTFCSINIATVFALSKKKTIIVGLDLRKPKLAEEFQLKNDVGVVNYLIEQNSLDEIIKNTQVPYLDVILAGPVPPNPSELIMNENMGKMMESLRKEYDYIILDTPPVGLVSDALELDQYSDVTLYIVRQNFTKKGMVSVLNNRVQRDELNNVSVILNGFENKAKYGGGYGYGYGYGNYTYSEGYHEDKNTKKSLFAPIVNWFNKLKK